MKQYPQYPPRYTSTPHSDSESSTHSVRVSRLIEKIKQTQRNSGHLYSHHNSVANNHPEAFNYLGGGSSGGANVNNSSELIYSRVERDNSAAKRTVRESVSSRYGLLNRNSSPPSTRPNHHNHHHHHNNNHHHHHHNNHRTTVLLNSEDTSPSDASPYEYESYGTKGFGGGGANQSSTRPARYFGEETDYEYDRVLSRNVKQQRESAAAATRHYSSATLGRSSHNNNGTSAVNSTTNRQNVPKIILHEEAVAEIPNGKVGGSSSIARSPSREFEYEDETQQQRGGGGSRFLGGLLTLKRGNKKNVTGGGSMTSNGGGTLRSTRSPSSRPYGASAQDSPKYYVPYRSTPTLYESRYERDRSSAAGSVLSNGSYMNKHVSRSMSMKAPWEPKHRVNEIDYYENSYNARRAAAAAVDEPDGVANKKRSKPGLTRSKSMPGKKLTSLIGNWVSKGSAKRAAAANGSEQEKLITGGSKGEGSRDASTLPNKGKHGGSGGKDGKSSWGLTLLRGFSRKGNKEKERNGDGVAPTKSGTLKKETRTSASPVRGATLGQKSSFDRGSAGGEIKQRGSSSSTLLRADRASSAGGTSSTLIRNSYATVDRRKRSGLAARADYY